MAFVPLIIDSEAQYARHDEELQSVLSLPLGIGSVIGHALKCLADLNPLRVLVLKASGVQVRLSNSDASSPQWRAVDLFELQGVIDDLDSSDCFIVLDTKSWPVNWPAAAEFGHTNRAYRGATHAIAIGTGLDRAIERIECDDDGQIRRVHRLYATANWPEVAGDSIAWSLVPARSLRSVHFTSLPELRHELAVRGVLSRDKPVAFEVMDLTRAQAYLALSERVVSRAPIYRQPMGYHSRADGSLIARDCQVAASARLVGPVFVCKGAVVGEKAMIVGPAVLGAESRVLAEAVVAQSVILPGAVVSAGALVRQKVFTGHVLSDTENETPDQSAPEPFTVPHELTRYVHHGRRRFSTVVKRLIDIAASGTALVVLSPLMLLIAALVRLDSDGPVLFGHVRERRGGREFRCLKFRTMVPDADTRQRELIKDNLVDGPQFKIADDPRVTRVGRWLRATNLDELPQLFNVLVGQMSLVGPRPSPFRENQICVAWRQARLSVRPGITGLWQICRATDRSHGDFHEWIYYDMAYVRNFSLWLDFKILVATIITLGGHWRVPMHWLIPGLRSYRGRPVHQAAA